MPLAVWLSLWLRPAHPLHPSFQAAGLWSLPAVLLVGLPLVALTGQYKGLKRHVGSRVLYSLAGRNGLLVLLLAGLGAMLLLPMPPRSSWILLWLLLTGFTGAVRFALRDLLLSVRPVPSSPRLCAWLATTRSRPFSMMRRVSGGARSTASRFSRPRC
jgi:hypothetical protein